MRTETMADEVRRSVDARRTEGGIQVRLVLSAPMEPSPAALWRTITDCTELASWYTAVDGELAVGGEVRTATGATGRILDIAEPHRLQLDWHSGEFRGELEIRVDPQDDGSSEITLVRTVTVSAEDYEARGPGGIALPWDVVLHRLADRTGSWGRAARDAALPLEAWAHSPQGQDAVCAWAIRWAGESLADGAEEEAARRGESATAAMYGPGGEGFEEGPAALTR